MGKPYFGADYTNVEALGLDDRFERAKDGNWIVVPTIELEGRTKRKRNLENQIQKGQPSQQKSIKNSNYCDWEI